MNADDTTLFVMFMIAVGAGAAAVLYVNWIRPIGPAIKPQMRKRAILRLPALRPWLRADTDADVLNELLNFMDALIDQGVPAFSVLDISLEKYAQTMKRARDPMKLLREVTRERIAILLDERGSEIDLNIWPRELLLIEDYTIRRAAHLSYVREKLDEL